MPVRALSNSNYWLDLSLSSLCTVAIVDALLYALSNFCPAQWFCFTICLIRCCVYIVTVVVRLPLIDVQILDLSPFVVLSFRSGLGLNEFGGDEVGLCFY